MPDYKEMYAVLSRRVTAAISDLQEAQRQVEEMYISSESTLIRLADAKNKISREIEPEK